MEHKPQDKPKAQPSPVQTSQPDPAVNTRPSDYEAPEYYSKDQKPSVPTPGSTPGSE